jgi:hypothetical protein
MKRPTFIYLRACGKKWEALGGLLETQFNFINSKRNILDFAIYFER